MKLRLALWLCLLAAALSIIARTPVSGDLSAFLPRSPPAADRALVEQLDDGRRPASS